MPTVHLSPPGSAERTTASAGNRRLFQLFSQLAQNKQSFGHRPVLVLDTSDSYVEEKHQAWDAETETDNSPKELYRVSKAGLESVPLDAVTSPNSPQMAPSGYITKEELKWLFTEALGIKNAQSTSDGKDSTSNKAAEDQDNAKVRVRASKVEYKTVNEVYVDKNVSWTLLTAYRWDSAKYEYKTVDSTPVPDIDELDEYIFVIRKRSREWYPTIRWVMLTPCRQADQRTHCLC